MYKKRFCSELTVD